MPAAEEVKKEFIDMLAKLRTGEYKELQLVTKVLCPKDGTFKSAEEECMDMELVSSGKIESSNQCLYSARHNGQMFPFSVKPRCPFFKGIMTGGMTQILRDVVCSFPYKSK
ncbi:MAG: hypothetical protein V1801_00755 [Candidatus Falkowbacteria bacterium]